MIERDNSELQEEDYDDSPWTSEERLSPAWEAGKRAGWDNMDAYDKLPAA
jgi:hypothetical protein